MSDGGEDGMGVVEALVAFEIFTDHEVVINLPDKLFEYSNTTRGNIRSSELTS